MDHTSGADCNDTAAPCSFGGGNNYNYYYLFRNSLGNRVDFCDPTFTRQAGCSYNLGVISISSLCACHSSCAHIVYYYSGRRVFNDTDYNSCISCCLACCY
ncbi:unnamed protein product [Rotaria sordida]|uniref:Uncharacterized protein n=1 Tax=Rotaria sordida TaxID=392033 RepID=A0A818L8T5_9BILA|nr:unnamed protein product [Rotaria sordida]CAF1540650.1 unnamed protein product [Rotaria sordida]CAF3562628.1 unnamed protein product [Rotaria sordida]CAF4049267.1 unnamed protein product [Rotaria sordida]